MSKSPFRYQVTREDCLPTSFVNALVALFDRRDIPPVVLQRIYLYSLDGIGSGGKLADGTTDEAISLLAEWLGSYEAAQFSLYTEVISGGQVHLRSSNRLGRCLREGGVAICNLQWTRGAEHSVLALNADKDWLYFWDPNPPNGKRLHTPLAELLESDGYGPNLRILRTQLDKYSSQRFAFGPRGARSAVLLWNCK